MMSNRRPLTLMQEWIVLLACTWFMTGLFVDGWAHNHQPGLESFFTPWHAIFYSGFFAVALSLLGFTWSRHKRGARMTDAIPRSYEYALLGCGVFMVGGMLDMLWHELLGVEADLEALLSPTHLILGIGMVMILSGPLRSWWQKSGQRKSLVDHLPLLLSLTLIFSSFTFLTQYAHFIDKGPGGLAPEGEDAIFHHQAIAFMAYQFQTFLLMGCIFFAMRRTRLPFGFITIMLTLNVMAMTLMRENREFILTAFVAGLLGDGLLQFLYRQSPTHPRVRIFAVGFPMILFALVNLTTYITQGFWWSVHMWTGAIVLPGMAGLILSFVAWPMEE